MQGEVLVVAKLAEGSGKMSAEAVGVENPRPPVSAGGKILQVVETVVVTLPRHARILIPRGGIAHIPQNGMRHPRDICSS